MHITHGERAREREIKKNDCMTYAFIHIAHTHPFEHTFSIQHRSKARANMTPPPIVVYLVDYLIVFITHPLNVFLVLFDSCR